MYALEVSNLKKKYPSFYLDNVNLKIKKGVITGFIGRNGAGKSTTLNCIMDFVHANGGEISFFGKDFKAGQNEIKQKVGFVSSGMVYYPKSKIKTITAITKSFFDNWDESAYKRYIGMFDIDENKTPENLSSGMKIKYALALALSHKAELLILDEPTSGLDPVSRDELLDVFLDLCAEGISILFSTHITSDLDKCADDIIYIKQGKIYAQSALDDFINSYRLVKIDKGDITEDMKKSFIGLRRTKNGMTALIKAEDENFVSGDISVPDLESLMIHLEKEVI